MADDQHSSSPLCAQLPPPPPRDEDGFSASFSVEDCEGIHQFFDKYGYVVVRNVISDEEVEASRNEVFSQFDSSNEEETTRFLSEFPNRFANMGILGMFNEMSPCQLANRQNETVYKAFVAVYGEEQLIVDHDRLGAMRPTKRADGTINEEFQTINNWLHLDCNPATGEISVGSFVRPDPHHSFAKEAPFVVQGVLALSDTRDEDGGFLCVPGSHRISKEWALINEWDKRHYPGQLRPEKDDPLHNHIEKIPLRAGSIVIWSGFTFHANHPNQSDRWRVNQYLRMYPVKTTRFLPYAPDERDYPEDFRPKITPLGRKLFGIDQWEEEKEKEKGEEKENKNGEKEKKEKKGWFSSFLS